MARTIAISKEYLRQSAFEMVREEGESSLSARKLAARAGCSTQPIFRVYDSMEELGDELFAFTMDYFDLFYSNMVKSSELPFVDMGKAYIRFAETESNLFRLLFLCKNRRGKSLYDLLNGKGGYLIHEISAAKAAGCENPQELFMKMWILIHGAACMTLTGDYDLPEEETTRILEECSRSFQ